MGAVLDGPLPQAMGPIISNEKKSPAQGMGPGEIEAIGSRSELKKGPCVEM